MKQRPENGPGRARRTSIDYRPQAQVRADAERAIARSQAAHAKLPAAAARNSIAHPTASVVKEPPTSVTAPRPTKTIPAPMRTPAQKRRWRYSHGAIMRCMPDRGGDAHHPRGPFGAVLSLGACIGMPPVGCGVGHPVTYQNDITLIGGSQERQCKPRWQTVSRPVLADQTRTISHVSLPAAQPKAQPTYRLRSRWPGVGWYAGPVVIGRAARWAGAGWRLPAFPAPPGRRRSQRTRLRLRTSHRIRSSAHSLRSRASSARSSSLSSAPPASRHRRSAPTQFSSVPGRIPRSRATCAIGLPVSRTSRTAPYLPPCAVPKLVHSCRVRVHDTLDMLSSGDACQVNTVDLAGAAGPGRCQIIRIALPRRQDRDGM